MLRIQIFAAIENHQMLDKTWMDMERGADEAGLRTKKQRDLDRACAAAENATWKMARTNPTTTTTAAAGTSALLTYITTRPITGLFELGETDWHETAFRNVAASLAQDNRSIGGPPDLGNERSHALDWNLNGFR